MLKTQNYDSKLIDMRLEVITPDAKLFEGEVTSVVAPGIDGYLGILKDHAPMISTLKEGELTFTTANGKEDKLDLKGGVLEVKANKISVLAD